MANSGKSPDQGRGISVRWILTVSIAFVVMLTIAPSLQRYFAQRAQINSLHNQISDANKELEQTKRDLAKWDDPEYVAKQARTRLHFVFPGERQYIVSGLPEVDNKDRKSTRLNSSHVSESRMPSSA